MTNGGSSNTSGNTNKSLLAIVASTGVLGVIASGYMAVANDARIAISVAEQHGQEILLLRGELNQLRQEMVERTQSRYTARDAAQHERYMEARLNKLEKEMDAMQKVHDR